MESNLTPAALTHVSQNSIEFMGLQGTLLEKEGMHSEQRDFISQILHMDCDQYDKIYKLDDGLAGSYLFTRGTDFVFIKCGSGVPIIRKTHGSILVIDSPTA